MENKMQDSKRDVEIEQRIGKFVRDFSIAVQDEQSVNYNILRKMLRELLASEISKAREEGVKDGMRGMIDILCEKGCGSMFAVIEEKDVNKKIEELSKLNKKK